MKTAHATQSTIPAGAAASTNWVGLGDAAPGADAFSALVQALADMGVQGNSAGNAATDGTTPVGGAAVQTTLSQDLLSVAKSTAADGTAKPAGKGKSSGSADDPANQPAAASATAAAPDPSVTPDLAALAILAAAGTVPQTSPTASSTDPTPGATETVQGAAPIAASDSRVGADAMSGVPTGGSAAQAADAGAVNDVAAQPAGLNAASDPTKADAAKSQPQIQLRLPTEPTAAPAAATTAQPQPQQAAPSPADLQSAIAAAIGLTSGAANQIASKGPTPDSRPAKSTSTQPADAQNTKSAALTATAATAATAPAAGVAGQTAEPQSIGVPALDGLPPAASHDGIGHSATKTASQDQTTQQSGTADPTQPIQTDPGAASIQTDSASLAAGSAAVAASGIQVSGTAHAAHSVDLPAATSASASDTQNLTLSPRDAALAASAVAQVNVIMQRAGLSGANSLTVQLDPAELGRVEVKLKIEKNGPVHASVTADRPQTLDMLRNDRGALEKALQSAGLSTDSGSLSFNLRGDGNNGQQQTGGTGQSGGRALSADDASTSTTATLDVVPTSNGWTAAGRLDLRV